MFNSDFSAAMALAEQEQNKSQKAIKNWETTFNEQYLTEKEQHDNNMQQFTYYGIAILF